MSCAAGTAGCQAEIWDFEYHRRYEDMCCKACGQPILSSVIRSAFEAVQKDRDGWKRTANRLAKLLGDKAAEIMVGDDMED